MYLSFKIHLLRRIFSTAGAALLAIALASCIHPDTITARAVLDSDKHAGFELTLLHVNDHHSHLDETRVPLSMDTGGGRRERIFVTAGGFARVTSAMRALSDQTAGPTIKIHAGDAITGDLYYSLTHGQADADLMNTVCFDTFTLGNHEFDYGDAGLKTFLDHLRSDNCQTQILSANVSFGPDSPLRESLSAGYVKPSMVLERNGRRIGLVGITVADKTQNASRPDPGTTFLDEATAAQEQIDALTRQGVDIVVLQTHYGYQNDLELAQRLRGVDVIIGGDSHTLLGPDRLKRFGLSPKGPYPTRTTDADGNPVCVAQAGHYSFVVGELKLSFDEDGRLVQCSGTPHILIGNDFARDRGQVNALDPDELDAVMNDVANSRSLRITTPDPVALQVLAPYQQQKVEFGSTVIAQVAQTLCARRIPGRLGQHTGAGHDQECKNRPGLEHGGDAQQIVAQAFLEQATKYFDADLALINAGGVRIDLSAGPLVVKDVHTLLPFKNTLVQLKIPGSTLRAALENAVQAALGPGRNTGAYPYAAGMRWVVDATRPGEARISQIEVADASGRYAPLDPDHVYSVATIDFIADGKDHYTPFSGLTKQQRVEVGLDATQLFLDYARELADSGRSLKPLPVSLYSTQGFLESP